MMMKMAKKVTLIEISYLNKMYTIALSELWIPADGSIESKHQQICMQATRENSMTKYKKRTDS